MSKMLPKLCVRKSLKCDKSISYRFHIICLNNKRVLHFSIKLPKYPAVYVKNGAEYVLYNGKVSALPIKEFIDKTFNINEEL